MSISNKQKIIVILGPTASGKSDLAVRIARHIEKIAKLKAATPEPRALNAKRYPPGAEIISADSRQVYRGLDLGSGKVPRDKKISKPRTLNAKRYFYKGIPHYLLDVASPKRIFTASRFQKLGKSALNKIIRKGRVPIICGGTGLYIDSLIYGYLFPKVSPQKELRKGLEKLETRELFKKLQTLDPERAAVIDKNNRPRLIRSLEIVITTGKPISKIELFPDIAPKYDVLKIGIKKSPEELEKLIAKRLYRRLKIGMVKEVKNLHKPFNPARGKYGLSWRRLDDLGLEYRYISRYLRCLISKKEMEDLIISESLKYAKRQMTWFKRDKNIHWIKNEKEAFDILKKELI